MSKPIIQVTNISKETCEKILFSIKKEIDDKYIIFIEDVEKLIGNILGCEFSFPNLPEIVHTHFIYLGDSLDNFEILYDKEQYYINFPLPLFPAGLERENEADKIIKEWEI